MAEMSFHSRVESSSIDGGERRRVASSLLSCKKGLKKKGRREKEKEGKEKGRKGKKGRTGKKGRKENEQV